MRKSLRILIAIPVIFLVLLVTLQLFTGIVVMDKGGEGPSMTIHQSKADHLFIKSVSIDVPGCDEAWIEKNSYHHYFFFFGGILGSWSWTTIQPGYVLAVRLKSSVHWSQIPKYDGHNLPQLNSVAHCGFAAIEHIDPSLFTIGSVK